MQRAQVQSSMIKSVGWENGTLEVEFSNGKIYTYPATEQEHKEMMAAESIGKHFNQHIKGRS